ncbi:MAG: SDR family oxidoreductase [Clostridiales Family XIII bacterium]|jgi:NAD(P)-dependent dehydrogenase (short-subunit alcohol dehydrogenase family)|nr:SDR family oxidoreductase [Clostridiales Family XIII bacterium]
MMIFDFSGKNAIVVGAASGIGKAIALQLADNGANVWCGDISEAGVSATVDEMKNKSEAKYGYSVCNVSQKESVAALFQDAASAFGEINIVVNSAGVFMPKRLLEATPEDIKKHLDINLMGIVYGCQLALETMIKQGTGGKIVNISSVGGRQGEAKSPFYALGKGAVLNWSQSVALYGAPHGINCNTVCPGIIKTPMWDTILEADSGGDPNVDKEELFNQIVRARTPLGRAQTAEEMAYAVAFFCSEYADAIVGQALNVDGGDKLN